MRADEVTLYLRDWIEQAATSDTWVGSSAKDDWTTLRLHVNGFQFKVTVEEAYQ